jgi:transcription elongation factor GreA
MNSKAIYLTQKGLEDLQKELNELDKVKRPQIVKELSTAREQGDLSENGAYTAAKEELAFIDGRIDELEVILKNVEVIEDKHSTKMVSLGAQVNLTVNGKKEVFTLVGEWEADPMEKKISHESPLGKALMGKKVGEEIEVDAPAGKMVYKIVSIS